MTFNERLVRAIFRYRGVWLALAGCITVAAAVFARRVAIDTSLDSWLLEDDAAIRTYQEFRRLFGEDQLIVVAVEADDVFRPRVLCELARLTAVVQRIDQVHRVTSLTNVRVLRRELASVTSGPLVDRLPRTEAEAARLREAAASFPLLSGLLVARDGRAAALVVELSRQCDTFEEKVAVVGAMRSQLEQHLPEITIRLAGSPVVTDAIYRYVRRDLRVLVPLALLVVVGSTYLLFRQIVVPLISLLVVALATLWVVGLMGILEVDMNLLGAGLLSIILVVGVADSVHILSSYYEEQRGGVPRVVALRRGLGRILLPCFVTSVTTMSGFLSLASSELKPIRQFGFLAAVGTGFAFVISIFLIPALAPLLSARRGRGPSSRSLMDRMLALLGSPTRRSSVVVLLMAMLVMVPALWSIRWIETTANPLNYLHAADPVRMSAEVIDEKLGGAANLEFVVRAPGEGMKDLRRLDAFETWLEQRPAVTQVLSLGRLLKEAERMRRPGGRFPRLPRSYLELITVLNIMERTEPDLLRSFVSSDGESDYSLGRISVRVRAAEADEFVAQAPLIERKMQSELNEADLRVVPTGFIKLLDDMRSYLIRSQIRSILLAFATITLVMLVLFRSWKMALFSMIPNLGPLVAGLAFMAVFGVCLDPGTVMIATIALGLVVDDSCHFLVRLRAQLRSSPCLRAALRETMSQTGRPIILTSVILASGFAIMAWGSFAPTFRFGLVSAFVLLTALLGALVVLPAAVLLCRLRL